MGAYGLAQGETADGRPVVELAHAGFAGMTQENALPCRVRKDCGVGASEGEVVAESRRLAAGKFYGWSGCCGGVAEARELKTGGFLLLSGSSGGEALRDEGPGAAVTFDEALGEQLVVCGERDGAGNTELLGEIARGWEAFAGREAAREDGLAQAEVDLAKERLACFRKWYR